MAGPHKHPLFVLQEMDERYRNRQPFDKPTQPKTTLGLGIRIQQQNFIINNSNLSEVLRLDRNRKISPIPGSKKWHLGLMSVRGHLTNIVDLGCYLMEKTTEISPNARIILIHRGQFSSGFLVDETVGVIRIDDDNPPCAIDKPLPGRLALACRQVLDLDGVEWIELDLDQMFNDPVFAQVTNT
jgi:chemotaxis signal transduction protein